jgi:hypothetical protein
MSANVSQLILFPPLEKTKLQQSTCFVLENTSKACSQNFFFLFIVVSLHFKLQEEEKERF